MVIRQCCVYLWTGILPSAIAMAFLTWGKFNIADFNQNLLNNTTCHSCVYVPRFTKRYQVFIHEENFHFLSNIFSRCCFTLNVRLLLFRPVSVEAAKLSFGGPWSSERALYEAVMVTSFLRPETNESIFGAHVSKRRRLRRRRRRRCEVYKVGRICYTARGPTALTEVPILSSTTS